MCSKGRLRKKTLSQENTQKTGCFQNAKPKFSALKVSFPSSAATPSLYSIINFFLSRDGARETDSAELLESASHMCINSNIDISIYIYPFLYFPSFYHPHIFLSASLLPPNPATPHPLCSPCCQLSSSSLSIFSSHHTNSSLEGRSMDIMNLFPKPAVLWIQTVPQIAASDPLLFTVTMETLDSPPHPQ